MDCYDHTNWLRRFHHRVDLFGKNLRCPHAILASWCVMPAWLTSRAGEGPASVESLASVFLKTIIGFVGFQTGMLSSRQILLWSGLCLMAGGLLWLGIMIRLRRDRHVTGPSKKLPDHPAKSSLQENHMQHDQLLQAGQELSSLHKELEAVREEARLSLAHAEQARKTAEAFKVVMTQERSLLRSLFHSIPDPIYCKDREGRYIQCNLAFEEFAALNESALSGLTDEEIFPPDLAAFRKEQERRAMEDRVLVRSEEWVEYPDGRRVLVDSLRTPFFGPDGSVLGLLGISRDITALNEAREKAEEATRAKGEFLARVSHDIRTPMNAIMSLVDLLLETDLESKQQEYLQIVKESSEGLLSLIDDLLDHGRMEAGKYELESHPFSLRETVKAALAPFAVRAEMKGLQWECEVSPDVPDALEGDSKHLRRILANLAGNAVKFTESGSVTVSIQSLGMEAGEVRLRFCVRDTGIGIPENQQEAVFDSYNQGEGVQSSRYGGTGLGLAIVKHLVELMNGEVHVASQVGAGSEFSVTINFDLAQANPAVQKESQPELPIRQSLRVLVAEDHPINRKVITEILNRMGHDTTVVENGLEALQSLENEGNYDVVLLDLQMPVMDGLACARAIRERERSTGGHIPLIALTASNSEEDRQRTQEAGMDDFLSKPVHRNSLAAAMNRLVPESHEALKQLDGADHQINSPADVFNETAALSILGGDIALFCQVARMFIDECPRLLKPICEAVQNGDAGSLEIAGHTLKGAVAGFQCRRAMDLALSLEKMGREGRLEEAVEVCRSLEMEMNRLCQSLIVYIGKQNPEESLAGEVRKGPHR